jgi:hypothetical protein
MALVKNVNSYATVEEANTYFADRIDVAAWTNAVPDQRAQALVTATGLLDALDWIGYAVSDSQSLAFPRFGVYFDPRLGKEVILSETTVPDRVLKAVYELSYHLLNNDGLLDDTGSVKDLSVGSIKLTLVKSANKLPVVVRNLVKPLRVNGGLNLWWRAN